MSLIPLQVIHDIQDGTRKIIFKSTESKEPVVVAFPPGRTTVCVGGACYDSLGRRIKLPNGIEKIVEFYGPYDATDYREDTYIVQLSDGGFSIARVACGREPRFVLKSFTYFTGYDNSSPVVNSQIFKAAFLIREGAHQNPMIVYGLSSEYGVPGETTAVCPSSTRFYSSTPWVSHLILRASREEAMSKSLDGLNYFCSTAYILCDEITVSPDGTTMFAYVELCYTNRVERIRVATDLKFLEFARAHFSANPDAVSCCWYELAQPLQE